MDHFFAQLNAGQSSAFANMGNEVNAGTPWLYDWLGQPTKAEAVVRRILTELYPDTPSGFPGNDDLGQMSAWYVMASIGMYPAIPGTDVLALGAPLFADVTLQVANGHTVDIAAGGATTRGYVAGLRIDGVRSDRPWIHFADLQTASSLVFTMSASATQSWGTAPGSAPPSFSATDPSTCS